MARVTESNGQKDLTQLRLNTNEFPTRTALTTHQRLEKPPGKRQRDLRAAAATATNADELFPEIRMTDRLSRCGRIGFSLTKHFCGTSHNTAGFVNVNNWLGAG